MDLLARVEAIVGRRVVALDEIPGAGGYTPALRRIATLDDGETVFVKAAVNDLTAGWLATEKESYEALDGAPFLPRYFGCDDQVLVLEDLRRAHWPPPWRQGDTDRVLAMLDDVAAHPSPDVAVPLESASWSRLGQWRNVASDPEPFLGLGVCTRDWFDRNIDVLVAQDGSASLAGDTLVHFDVRSDNLCLLDDGRTVLVDWNHTSRGRADFDRICLAQSVTLEGGPEPEVLAPHADPAVVAMITGYFAYNAPMPIIQDAPRVRDIQLAQLKICLPWMTRLLHL